MKLGVGGAERLGHRSIWGSHGRLDAYELLSSRLKKLVSMLPQTPKSMSAVWFSAINPSVHTCRLAGTHLKSTSDSADFALFYLKLGSVNK
jgi:hypothetical protein